MIGNTNALGTGPHQRGGDYDDYDYNYQDGGYGVPAGYGINGQSYYGPPGKGRQQVNQNNNPSGGNYEYKYNKYKDKYMDLKNRLV